jgi:hypothetical protein
MNSRVLFSTTTGATLLNHRSPRSTFKDMSYSLFRTIPPERVGLHGEYDHSGLAKRVMLAFRESLPLGELSELRVSQRGRVVILMGRVSNYQTLYQLTNLALDVEGATDVETFGIRVR